LRIPKERIAVLIGKKGEIKRSLEDNAKCKIVVDSKDGVVFVSGSDALSLFAVREVIKAIGRGFNPDVAQLLFRQDYGVEFVNISDFARNQKDFERLRGRVIGEAGKSRRVIEDLTGTNLCVYGKTVGIIGPLENVVDARRAVESLLSGSTHARVYRWLEKRRKESQKDISVAEFFERNRHLLGFDNKRKALLTVVKEAVDNSLDACEEGGILPDINVEIIDMGNDRFRVVVEDNGPGIVKAQIPNIFARLLYGSKFHRLKQARGQQGIGISASVLYAQLTTGRAAKITSKTSKSKEAHYFELGINTKTNKPEILKEEKIDWHKEHGTKIQVDIEASYARGDQSVDSYLKQTAIANPHANIAYTNPKAEQFIFSRVVDVLPKEPKEVKPHPYGVEIGVLVKMLRNTECRSLQSFLMNEFSRVGSNTAHEICDNAGLFTNMKPHELQLPHIEKLMEGIKKTKIIAPTTDCISPIGADLLEAGLRKEVAAEFYAAVSRSPQVYRGIPFVVECAIAFGGDQPKDQGARLLRFANRVPLLYQQGSGACFKSVVKTNWRSYGLHQSQNSLPQGPLTIIVSLASVWPPFTSEAKEAIAHYPEIIKEMRLALQDVGRKLGSYVKKKRKVSEQQERINTFEGFIPEVADALFRLSGVSKVKLVDSLKKMLSKSREFVAEHKEKHKVESLVKKDKESKIELRSFEDEEV